MWKHTYRVMQEAGGDGGAGGGGGEGGDSAAAEAAAAAAAAAGDAAKGTETGEAGAQGAESLLKGGEGAPESIAPEFIPEKFQVKNDAGELDIEASARKMAESYAHLEKKAGTGDAPPKSADDYGISPPDEFKNIDFKADPEIKDFLGRAHEAGLTQAQMDLVMGEYFRLAPQLVAGGAAISQEEATENLKKVWATDSDFKRNSHLAYSATAAAVERSGVTMDEVEQAGLGNNPVFLRLMASLGAEFQEDSTPGGTVHKSFGEEDIQQMETSEAYKDPKHPDHEKVSKQVKNWYDRKYGTEAAA